MAKTNARTVEEDTQALKKKVTERIAGVETPSADKSIRALRKRLKRTQRKIRGVKARAARAVAKKKAEKK